MTKEVVVVDVLHSVSFFLSLIREEIEVILFTSSKSQFNF